MGPQVKGVQPMASPDDCNDAEEVAKGDPRVQELLAKRGITDMSLVACDPWSGAAPNMIRVFPYRKALIKLKARGCVGAWTACIFWSVRWRPS